MNSEHIMAQLLVRAWPFPRGAGRIIDRLFSHLSFSEDRAFVQTTDGFGMYVLPNDLVGRHLYLSGEFDRTIVEVLCRLARAGDTLLDIGANIGYVSCCFLKNVHGSRVIAVEPQPSIYALLQKNLSQFGGRADCFPVAISNRSGTGRLKIDPSNFGGGELTTEQMTDAIPVELWTPDQLVERLPKVDLIKIDVEGHEEQVLTASSALIARYCPRAILFEHRGTKTAPGEAIEAVLSDLDYVIYGIQKRLTTIDYVPIRRKDDCHYNDYIAQSGGRGARKASDS